jgi:phage tail protein X
MAFNYRTKTGDTVDLIAWQYYGRQDRQLVEKILETNTGLADRGAELPAGVLIALPDAPDPGVDEGVRLWD